MDLDFKFLGTDFSWLKKDYRYEGWFIGAGVAYGYAWALSKHWNLPSEAIRSFITVITIAVTLTLLLNRRVYVSEQRSDR